MSAIPHLHVRVPLLCSALFAASFSAPLPAQTAPANHLSGSRSTYLQHAAQQPVDWRPLGQPALDLAQKLERPLLIDVGATWCSWCTLMDRDSYTHPGIARFINANFVAVKIDYDADPNLTRNLEHAAALENLPAGIPLTLFVSPQLTLYDGGSYYPPAPSGSKISLQQALNTALARYRTRRSAIAKDGVKLNLMQEKQP